MNLFNKYKDYISPTKVILDTGNKTINLVFESSLNAENALYNLEIKEDLELKYYKSIR